MLPRGFARMLFRKAIDVYRTEGLVSLLVKSARFIRRLIILDYLPTRIFAVLAPYYWRLHPNRPDGKIRYSEYNNIWMIEKEDGPPFYTPNPKVRHGQELHSSARLEGYTIDDFATIEEGDTVVDIGAFVGGFTTGAAQKADQVIAVEPDPRNAICLQLNTQELENVAVVQKAAWMEEDELLFNISIDPTDSSLLSPDWGNTSDEVVVEAARLDTIMDEVEISYVDFLKMDTEGAEPEALAAIDQVMPKKIAVSCGAERNGEDTKEAVTNILESNGYSTRTKENAVIGRLD